MQKKHLFQYLGLDLAWGATRIDDLGQRGGRRSAPAAPAGKDATLGPDAGGKMTGKKKRGRETGRIGIVLGSLYIGIFGRKYRDEPKNIGERENFWETDGALLFPILVFLLGKGGLLEKLLASWVFTRHLFLFTWKC